MTIAIRIRRHAGLLLVTGLGAITSACRAQTLQSDQVDLRRAVIHLYEDQLVDNVIRAKRQEPMLQMAYSAMTGTVTTKLAGTSSLLRGKVDNDFGATPGMSQITDATSTTANLAVTVNRDVMLNMRGDPVTDREVYDEITHFATTANLKVSESPPEGEVVAAREIDGLYYWIPGEARGHFFELYEKVVYRANAGHALNLFQELTELPDKAASSNQ